MSIATVVSRGFGTFGTAVLVVTGGYSIGAAVVAPPTDIPRLRFPSHVKMSVGIGGPAKSTPVNVASSGNTVIVAGVAGRIVVVLSYVLKSASAVTAKWRTGGGADLTGEMAMDVYPIVADHSDEGHFQTETGQSLQLNLSGSVQVGGHVTYTVV